MRLTRREALMLLAGAVGAACSPAGGPGGAVAPTLLSTAEPTIAPTAARLTATQQPTAAMATAVPTQQTTAATATAAPTQQTTATTASAAPTQQTTAATATAATTQQTTAATATAATTQQTTAATATAAPTTVLAGIDVLMQQRIDVLRGRNIGLVTNATGRDGQGRSTIDVLHAEPAWRLVALFSPEHGIRGDAAAGQAIDSSVDQRTGLPIHSLYGATTRPTDAMLRGVDTLVYDIQDVGARTYTYASTLLEIMRAAGERGLSVVVLDRPNPIGGDQVEGNVLDRRFASFVGAAPIAMRYGLTIGELGQYFNASDPGIQCDLTIVSMQAWRRETWFDQTGLEWVSPSPNLRSLTAATLYPGTVLVEGSNLSEGRGTQRPFEWVGAPWMDANRWADRLNGLGLPGVRFSPASRTPESSKFAGQLCHGVTIDIVDRLQVRPMELGVAILAAARSVAGGRLQLSADSFDRLAGTDQVRKGVESGAQSAEIASAWQPDLQRFTSVRARHLLY